MSPSEFLNTLVVDILGIGLSEKKIENHGGVKNTLWQCSYRNTKVGYKVIDVLTSLIQSEIRFDKSKKYRIYEFLKQFLTKDEKKYIENNPDDIKSLVRFASMKITNKNEGLMVNKKNYNDEEIKVYSVDELKKKGWSDKAIIINMTKAFNANIPKRPDNDASFESRIERLKCSSETRKILLDSKDNLIGYWVFIPLFDKYFEKAKNGELTYEEMTREKIPLMFPDSTYNIEFGATLLLEDYRKRRAFKILLYSIIEYIEELAKEGTFIKEIVAKSSSKDGIALITDVGFNFHKMHPDGNTKIYHVYTKDLMNRTFLKRFESLRNLYNERFK
jgi:hypothetical protein